MIVQSHRGLAGFFGLGILPGLALPEAALAATLHSTMVTLAPRVRTDMPEPTIGVVHTSALIPRAADPLHLGAPRPPISGYRLLLPTCSLHQGGFTGCQGTHIRLMVSFLAVLARFSSPTALGQEGHGEQGVINL